MNFIFNLYKRIFPGISQNDFELVKQTGLFPSVTASEFNQLKKSAIYIKYSKNSLIIKEKDIADALYVIKEGDLRVYTHNALNEKIPLARLKKGDYFGEQGLIGQANKSRNANVETITDSVLIKIDEKYLIPYLETDINIKKKLQDIGYDQALKNLNYPKETYEEIKKLIETIGTKKIIEYPDNKIIFSEGDPSDNIYFILNGKVEINFQNKDKQKNFSSVICHKGQFFGELGVIKNQPRSGTAITREFSKILVIPSEYIVTCLSQYKSIQNIFQRLEKIYKLPHAGTVEQYTGDTQFGEQLTSIFKLNDGRTIVSSTLLKQDMLVISSGLKYENIYKYKANNNKLELFVQNNKLVQIKSYGWWDCLPTLCRSILENYTFTDNELEDFTKTGDLYLPEEVKPHIDRDIICDCMLVSKNTLQDCINKGIKDLPGIILNTRACTVCRCCKYRILELLGENPWMAAKMKKEIVHNEIMNSYILQSINTQFTKNWQAGQHVIIQAKIKNQWIERTYTISDITTDNLRVTIKKEPNGLFTSWLFDVAPDEFQINLTQPQGEFLLDMDISKSALCIAGGIGITPFITFAKWIKENNIHKKMHILYCAQKNDYLIFKDEFSNIAKTFPLFTIQYRTDEKDGLFTPQVLTDLIKKLNQPDVYICGSPGFVNLIKNTLHFNNYPQNKIHNEEFCHVVN